MNYTCFVGIDISKATIDVAVNHVDSPDKYSHQQFANSIAGGKKMLTWLRKQEVTFDQAFFIMEHTGWYTLELCWGSPAAFYRISIWLLLFFLLCI